MSKHGNKKRLLILSFCAAAILLILCVVLLVSAREKADRAYALAYEDLPLGNTPANVINDGMAVETDGTVFYSNNGIYVKPAGGDAYELTDNRAQSLATWGDWLYFCNLSDSNRCYRIKMDGTGLEDLTDFSVEYLNIVGDKVYFACIKEIDRCGIYCMDADGENLVQLGKQYVAALTACCGRLYYLDKDRDNALYTMKYTGDGIKKITGEYTYCPVLDPENGKIYYSTKSGVYESSLLGGSRKKINDLYGSSLALDGSGNLYIGVYNYTSSNGDGIYRCTTAGDNLRKIRDDDVMYLAFAGGSLWFKSMTQSFSVMRCDTDGENGIFAAGGATNSIAGE